jgi:hypothetical protein
MVFRQAGTALSSSLKHRFPSAPPRETDSVPERYRLLVRREPIDVLILGCTHFVFLRDQPVPSPRTGNHDPRLSGGRREPGGPGSRGRHLESSDNRKTRNGGGKRSERLFFETGTQGASTAILAIAAWPTFVRRDASGFGREGADGSVACIRETGA